MGIKFLLLPIAAAVFALPGHKGTKTENAVPAGQVEVRTILHAYTWDGMKLTNSACRDVSIEEPQLEEVVRTLRELEVKMHALQQERMRVLEQMIQLKEELARELPIAPPAPPSPTSSHLDLPVACGSLAVPVRIEKSGGTARG